MLNEEQQRLAEETLTKYGYRLQQMKAQEELSELTVALSRLMIKENVSNEQSFTCLKKEMEEVITEIADVYIMLYQLSQMFGEENVKKEIQKKTIRQIHRNRALTTIFYHKSKKHIFTKAEKEVLRNISPNFKYIAKDKDGSVYIYEGKPVKTDTGWDYPYEVEFLYELRMLDCFQHLFSSLKTEDEPIEIDKHVERSN